MVSLPFVLPGFWKATVVFMGPSKVVVKRSEEKSWNGVGEGASLGNSGFICMNIFIHYVCVYVYTCIYFMCVYIYVYIKHLKFFLDI